MRRDCSARFQDGALVTLSARTTNGSGYSFTGWSGNYNLCAGSSFHDCALSMTAARSVTATFTNQPYNLAFVSSTTFATNLGSAVAYDAQCNTLATNAGINNAAGNAYIAWVSGFGSAASARLGSTARGWVRLDGVPFADDVNSLLTANRVFNPINRDEAGASVIAQPVLTGTQSNGALSAGSCSGWTAGGVYGAGDTAGGPIAWTFLPPYANCNQAARIYCLMNTLTATLTPPVHAGRKIWTTAAAYVPGSPATPDQTCNADRPPGVANAKAVIATATSPAVDVLSLTDTYVRPDGQIVGIGFEISITELRTGTWQTASGAYLDATASSIWTGDAALPTENGSVAGTCMSWTSSSTNNGGFGIATVSAARWWNFSTVPCSDTSTRLVCAEQ